MNTIKIYKVLVSASLLFSLLAITSCRDSFLDITPPDQLSDKAVFNSLKTIQAAMTGLYDLTSQSTSPSATAPQAGDYANDMILTGDVKGGDVMVVSDASNYDRYVVQYQFSETVNSTYSLSYWSVGHRVIANANLFVANIPNSPLSADEKTQYIAEARALRAEAYFKLVRYFAKPFTLDPNAMGLPIIKTPLTPNDVTPKRNTVKEVYDLILEDLLFAEQNLSPARTSIYRMNVRAIQGYLARIYLTMGNWSKASEYAKLARTGKPLSTAAALLSGFNAPTSEWIYAINVRTDDNYGFLMVSSFYDPYDVGYSSFRVTDEFFDSFSEKDERKKQFLVKNSPTAAASTARYRRRGSEGWLINKFDFNTTNANNQVLIRSSEMYLIEAEAEARLGNETPAKAALLEIQKRANVATEITTNTGEALIAEILKERDKELYGEGHKFFDLLRTKTPIDRTASISHWAKVKLEPGDNKLVLPIPQAEIDANPVLKDQQNPGY